MILTHEQIDNLNDKNETSLDERPLSRQECRNLIRTIEAQQQEINKFRTERDMEVSKTNKLYAEIRALTADKDEQAGRIMLLEEALKKIANPILHMQKEAKSVGCVLDGAMAIRLSEDPHYYRKIAQKAIDALLGGKEDEKE